MVRPHWVIGFNVSARLVWPPLLALKQVRSSAATRWLQGVVGQIHSRISFLQTTPILEDAVRLDPKEATYLRWIAVGMTMEEMADVEGVKYNSVRVKLREAMKRFDVRSKAHLTALAIRRKLI